MSNNIYQVYKTINLVNGKIYIGVHKENGRKYYGSGVLIKRAIKKYGKENFKVDILHEFNDIKDAYLKEAEIVDKSFIESDDNYNCQTGGKNKVIISDESKKKMSRYASNRSKEHQEKINQTKRGYSFSSSAKQSMSEARKKLIDDGYEVWNKGKTLSDTHKENLKKNHRGMKGKKHSPETKEKMRQARLKKLNGR